MIYLNVLKRIVFRGNVGVDPSEAVFGVGLGGFDSYQGRKIFSLPRVVRLIPFTRANAQWVILGLN